MRDWSINIDKIPLISVINCEISRKVNEHAYAVIEGYIEGDNEEDYIRLSTSNTYVSIYAKDRYEKVTLFCGIVKDIEITVEASVHRVKISLISGTYLLDNIEHNRTYQNVNMTYNDLIKKYTSSYENCACKMGEESSKILGNFIVQYKETDWEFIKRMGSNFNKCIIPEATLEGVKFYFGLLKEGEMHTINSMYYSIKKDVGEYIYKSSNNVSGISELDATYYEVTSRDIFKICDKVKFKNKILYIHGVETQYNGAELVHKYILKSENGFKIKQDYNEKLIGTSLAANIIDVQKDTVKVSAKIDGSQDVETAIWFPYSTVYSSPDGTGWYCMPEKGDEVRMYFPTEKEKNCYIISAVNLESSDSNARSNPDNKSIKSKYGKEVLLKPDSILITNNKGMSISIEDEKGISIISDKEISIKSDKKIDIISAEKDVNIAAPEELKLKQGATSMVFKEDVTLKGSKIKLV